MSAIIIHAPKDLRVEQVAQDHSVKALDTGDVRIDVAVGGICGSDLHYYHHGGFGTVRIAEPMVLGHEVAGVVTEVASDVTDVAVGDRVAVNPSRPCHQCEYCLKGQPNHCLDMRFYGSAMRTPHVQGAFRKTLVAEATQCEQVGEGVSMNVAAFAEPFSVALHAITRAGALAGKRVLVTGCGPIGALAALAARYHGAREVVATDVLDEPLQRVQEINVDRVINIVKDPDALMQGMGPKGYYDVMIEASGNERAIRSGLDVLRPRGVLVQLGLGGDVTLPQNTVVAKEIEIRGSFRFHEEFAWAVELLCSGKVNVDPLLSDVYAFDDAVEAFEIAGDRQRAMKVQIDFTV